MPLCLTSWVSYLLVAPLLLPLPLAPGLAAVGPTEPGALSLQVAQAPVCSRVQSEASQGARPHDRATSSPYLVSVQTASCSASHSIHRTGTPLQNHKSLASITVPWEAVVVPQVVGAVQWWAQGQVLEGGWDAG
jgi:hypothetical protein